MAINSRDSLARQTTRQSEEDRYLLRDGRKAPSRNLSTAANKLKEDPSIIFYSHSATCMNRSSSLHYTTRPCSRRIEPKRHENNVINCFHFSCTACHGTDWKHRLLLVPSSYCHGKSSITSLSLFNIHLRSGMTWFMDHHVADDRPVREMRLTRFAEWRSPTSSSRYLVPLYQLKLIAIFFNRSFTYLPGCHVIFYRFPTLCTYSLCYVTLLLFRRSSGQSLDDDLLHICFNFRLA